MVGRQVSDPERCLSPGSGHGCLKPCPTRWCPRELFTLSWCVYNSHFTRVYGRYSISNYLLWFINQQTSLGGHHLAGFSTFFPAFPTVRHLCWACSRRNPKNPLALLYGDQLEGIIQGGVVHIGYGIKKKTGLS